MLGAVGKRSLCEQTGGKLLGVVRAVLKSLSFPQGEVWSVCLSRQSCRYCLSFLEQSLSGLAEGLCVGPIFFPNCVKGQYLKFPSFGDRKQELCACYSILAFSFILFQKL